MQCSLLTHTHKLQPSLWISSRNTKWLPEMVQLWQQFCSFCWAEVKPKSCRKQYHQMKTDDRKKKCKTRSKPWYSGHTPLAFLPQKLLKHWIFMKNTINPKENLLRIEPFFIFKWNSLTPLILFMPSFWPIEQIAFHENSGFLHLESASHCHSFWINTVVIFYLALREVSQSDKTRNSSIWVKDRRSATARNRQWMTEHD